MGMLPRRCQGCVESTYFGILTDLVIFGNAVIVGLEVDQTGEGSLFELMRHIFCSIYLLELIIRILAKGKPFFFKFSNVFDMLLILSAITYSWILLPAGVSISLFRMELLWQITALRLLRYLRIIRLASRWKPLKDLWLVLMGLRRAARPFAWLVAMLGLILFSAGIGVAGFMKKDLAAAAEGEDFDLDLDMYFGSIQTSVLTMLQLATLDGWSSKIVRPLYETDPLAAFVLGAFSVFTAYGFLNVAVGVFVWSTVELARSSEDHASHAAAQEDAEIIAMLRKHFAQSLYVEDRTMMDLVELSDAMSIPQVARAFKQLDLPATVSDVKTLFNHLDKERAGEITLDQFQRGLEMMKKPANRKDVACLTAGVGGVTTGISRIERRAEKMIRRLDRLGGTLNTAFAMLGAFVDPSSDMGQVPEVVLRRAHTIKYFKPLTPRYTEGFE